MSWLKEVIGTEKAVIAMCHLRALPGDPSFDAQLGMNWVIDKAWDDLMALQNGGVDAVMFSNEFSLPYLTKVRPENHCGNGTNHRAINERYPHPVWRECSVGSGRLIRPGDGYRR